MKKVNREYHPPPHLGALEAPHCEGLPRHRSCTWCLAHAKHPRWSIKIVKDSPQHGICHLPSFSTCSNGCSCTQTWQRKITVNHTIYRWFPIKMVKSSISTGVCHWNLHLVRRCSMIFTPFFQPNSLEKKHMAGPLCRRLCRRCLGWVWGFVCLLRAMLRAMTI